MTAMLDFRTIRNLVAYPARWALRGDTESLIKCEAKERRPLVMRWRRGKDGKLEGHWNKE